MFHTIEQTHYEQKKVIINTWLNKDSFSAVPTLFLLNSTRFKRFKNKLMNLFKSSKRLQKGERILKSTIKEFKTIDIRQAQKSHLF